MAQLSLFEDPAAAGQVRPGSVSAEYADTLARAAAIARGLPEQLHFGTSSWSFPGWAGLVYPDTRSQAALARDGLRTYARHPLLRTVGIDRGYYTPIPEQDLLRYAAQLPRGFRACAKAPASVMSAAVPGTRHGASFVPNPTFLSAERLRVELLDPFDRAFADHTGPFILECAPLPHASVDPRWVLDGLFSMLSALPRHFCYAIELRDRRLLTAQYANLLQATGAAHVFSYWSGMPALQHQAGVVSVEHQPVTVIWLLLRPGTRYEDQRDRFRPFNRLVEPDSTMRDQVVALIGAAVRVAHPIYVLVNNKAEGSAPLTIEAIARRLAAERDDVQAED